MKDARHFPPRPRGLRGRKAELRVLGDYIRGSHPTRLALVGSGGSGKSLLAAALGHEAAPHFGGQIAWFRVGGWDYRTLAEMLAIRFGTARGRTALLPALRAHLASQGPMLCVLDNHEDDRSMARFLDELRETDVTWLITARRCLLAGVTIFPVVAPLISTTGSAFPAVASLTRLLRWNPLALDIAQAYVHQGDASARDLGSYLVEAGINRVKVIDHEDDLQEVGLLVAWGWERLPSAARRILGVLAHVAGDHVDHASLLQLARAGSRSEEALELLRRWHLVQEPFQGRYALHAVVRYAISKRTTFEPRRIFEHYLRLLEQEPDRLDMEQTHLFAAMDYAHTESDLTGALRIHRLLSLLETDEC